MKFSLQKGISLAFQEVPNRAFAAVFAFPFQALLLFVFLTLFRLLLLTQHLPLKFFLFPLSLCGAHSLTTHHQSLDDARSLLCVDLLLYVQVTLSLKENLVDGCQLDLKNLLYKHHRFYQRFQGNLLSVGEGLALSGGTLLKPNSNDTCHPSLYLSCEDT